MRRSKPRPLFVLMLAFSLVLSPYALAGDPAESGRGGEVALARELIAQREQLDRMRLDQSVSKEALRAQERRLMEVRSRLAAAVAGELARQSADAEQWRQAWESMKGFVRDKLRTLLDEDTAPATRT